MPQISVIVPVYNTEQYLRQCLDSILCQTFSDFELILVDDGSSGVHIFKNENTFVAKFDGRTEYLADAHCIK